MFGQQHPVWCLVLQDSHSILSKQSGSVAPFPWDLAQSAGLNGTSTSDWVFQFSNTALNQSRSLARIYASMRPFTETPASKRPSHTWNSQISRTHLFRDIKVSIIPMASTLRTFPERCSQRADPSCTQQALQCSKCVNSQDCKHPVRMDAEQDKLQSCHEVHLGCRSYSYDDDDDDDDAKLHREVSDGNCFTYYIWLALVDFRQ